MYPAEHIVRRQLDALLDGDTRIAFQLASRSNRDATAPPDGYGFAAFDRVVRTAFSPLLTADDYRVLRGGTAGHLDVLLYVHGHPHHAYRFELSQQRTDDSHPSLAGDRVVGRDRPWRTDAVVALPSAKWSTLQRRAHQSRQGELRRACFGDAWTDPSVSHSFGADRTHNMCCDLGETSKEFSDASGNPIGRAATAVDCDGDTSSSPWSTCLGSNVCGVLGAKFGDTSARFAVSPDLSRVATHIPPGSAACEAYVAQLLDTPAHGTPGLTTRGDPTRCAASDVQAIKAGLLRAHRDIDAMLHGTTQRKPRAAVCVMLASAKAPVSGVVYFVEQSDHSVRVDGRLHGLTPGEHGLHVHEAGDLTDGCASACAHLNPYDANHGGRDAKERHVGDLGNVVADDEGVATFQFLDDRIRLRRKSCNVIGRMLVVHAQRDDCGRGGTAESLRTGNAGARVGCGVIGYARSQFE
jgi:superoxide dismutase, Cu-Zn family